MEHLPKIQSRGDLQKSTPPSMSASAAKEATRIAEKILGSYPDYGKAPDGYLLAVSEFIAYVSIDDQEALAHPMTGIASRSRYLPTIAELKQFVDDRAKRRNTRATGYRYFAPGEMVAMEPADRRKAQVLAELGYDPMKPREEKRRPLEPAILDAIQEGSYSASSLQTPAGPPSPELKALLIEQGYLIPPKREDAAA